MVSIAREEIFEGDGGCGFKLVLVRIRQKLTMGRFLRKLYGGVCKENVETSRIRFNLEKSTY